MRVQKGKIRNTTREGAREQGPEKSEQIARRNRRQKRRKWKDKKRGRGGAKAKESVLYLVTFGLCARDKISEE